VILHNASIDASGGDGPFAAYDASKAGLLGLNRTMALELGRHGIRSNCVCGLTANWYILETLPTGVSSATDDAAN
jgi:NAD(P)-dependent dehydrogenase (short-subunit alcohol dehydrogenase family)